MCRWLELVAEFDRREGWGSWGCKSCADWVAWRCAVAPRAAREHVRVARALVDLPEIHAAFSKGELSYSKVRALTRVASPDSERELLELSHHATAAQLERICRGLRRVTADEADRTWQERYLTHFWDPDDGVLCIYARIPAEDGALVLRALEAARDRLWESEVEDGDNEEGGSAEPQLPDAQQARRSDSGGIVDVSTLSRDANGTCELEDQVAVSPETARRLACDAELVEVIEKEGSPLHVGRRSRKVPPRLRRAIEQRDRTCTFPGCHNRRFLDAHHIRHWARGGKTDDENLTLLCRYHHRLLHESGFAVERLAGGELRFRRPDGSDVPISPPSPAGGPAAVPLSSGSLLTGTGERADLGLAVDGLADRFG
jgi:hypothetical protein